MSAGHTPSNALMERLTPERRTILTQRATKHDTWGQSHVNLLKFSTPPKGGEPGHTYAKIPTAKI